MQGYLDAQHQLFYLYAFEEGVIDYKHSMAWAKKSIEQEYAEGYHHLSYLYEHGKGVRRNVKKAILYMSKAAELGLALSQVWLGKIYLKGSKEDKIQQDLPLAFHWLTLAAEQENAEAQYHLATCYEQRLGVEADAEKAQAWREKAKNNGYV